MNSAAKLSFVSCSAIIALLASACSQSDVWEPKNYMNKAKCASNNKPCFEGYECMVGYCTLRNSLGVGETCLGDYVCQDGLVCAKLTGGASQSAVGYVCKTSCDLPYSSDKKCDTSTYCKPVKAGQNACTESECSVTNADALTGKPGKKCQSGNQDCAIFKSGVGACFNSCEYWFDSNGVYKDSITVSGKACHPVGITNPIMAEVDAGAGGEGDSCDMVNNPCRSGYVCIKGQGRSEACHKLCVLHDDNTQTGCIERGKCNPPEGISTEPYFYCSLGEGEDLGASEM